MFGVSGSYLRADASSASRGARAEYISAPFKLTSPKCISFRYQQLNPASSGNHELRVVVEEPVISRQNTLWGASPTESGWKQGKATLSMSDVKHSAIRISFQAVYGGNRTTEMQIDNIAMSDGACSESGMQIICT